MAGAFSVQNWEIQEEFDTLVATSSPSTKLPTRSKLNWWRKWPSTTGWLAAAMLCQEKCMHLVYPTCEPILHRDLAVYMRCQTTHDRAFQRCANELRSIKKQKENQQIGFESQKRREASELRKQASAGRQIEQAARKQAHENSRQKRHKFDVLLADAKVGHQKVLTSNVRRSMFIASQSENQPLTVEKAA